MASTKNFKKAAKAIQSEFVADRIIVSYKYGVIKLRTTYFYRSGRDCKWWKRTVESMMRPIAAEHGFTFVVSDVTDHWNTWPKNSYFQALVEIVEPNEPILVETIAAENWTGNMRDIEVSVDRMAFRLYDEHEFVMVTSVSPEDAKEYDLGAMYHVYHKGEENNGVDWRVMDVYALEPDGEFTAKQYLGTADCGIDRCSQDPIHAAAKVLFNLI